MLSFRSRAAILCSAIRLSRAAFLRSPLGSKALINTQKNATNMPPNMATNTAIDRAASMPVSYEHSIPPKARKATFRRAVQPKNNTQRSIRTLPLMDVANRRFHSEPTGHPLSLDWLPEFLQAPTVHLFEVTCALPSIRFDASSIDRWRCAASCVEVSFRRTVRIAES